MRILYDFQIFGFQRFGGVSRYHIELKNGLESIGGVKVDIPIVFNANEYLAKLNNKRTFYTKHGIINRGIELLDEVLTIAAVRTKKYDIIHPTWYTPYMNISKWGKYVITIHDMIHELYPDGQEEQIAFKKRAIYESDLIIAISENTKKDIIKFYPDIPESKIKVVYHGTNHLPEPVKPQKIELPDRYILFVGGRGNYKNGFWLLESAAELLKNDKSLSLLYVGGNRLETEYTDFAIEHGIQNQVVQYNASDAELAYLYNHAICFVYPSSYEGFGFPILEAFDNGCPVVCSDNSSLPEVAGDAALFFEDKNKEALLEKIEEFILDKELREQYIKRGKDRVKEFTWEKASLQTYEAYRQILATDRGK